MTTRKKKNTATRSIERETFEHSIEIDLTDAELAAGRKRNMQIDIEIDAVKQRQTAANAVFKEELEVLKREQKPLKEAEKTKKAKVEVNCYHQRDTAGARMLTLRCDTDEVVDERALTAEEREADRGLFEGDEDDSEEEAS